MQGLALYVNRFDPARLEHLLLRTPPFVRYSSHVIETSSTQSVEGGRVLLGQIP